MELDMEQIVKTLECFHHRILNSDLAEKITEQEMMAIIDAIALIRNLDYSRKCLLEDRERTHRIIKEYVEDTEE